MTDAQLINQNSSDVEYFTPLPIVNLARQVMGGIDLDPASSTEANAGINARNIYTIKDDGITQPWYGAVWLNHPFGRREIPCAPDCAKKHTHHDYLLYGNSGWITKLMNEWNEGNIEQACTITYASTSEKWFRPLLEFPQCFITTRTNYYLPDGTLKKGVTKGSVVTYLGPRVNRFAQAFNEIGVVKIPWQK